MEIFGMGPLEIALIAALALVVFGPDKLPELARQIGKVLGDIRRISMEVTSEFQRSIAVDEPGTARPKGMIVGRSRERESPSRDEEGGPVRNPEGPLPPY